MGRTFGGLILLIKSYSEVFGTWLNTFAFRAQPFIIFHEEMPTIVFAFSSLNIIWALGKAEASLVYTVNGQLELQGKPLSQDTRTFIHRSTIL